MTVKIYCGDCLEIMRGMADKSVDAVITDPPYDERTHNGAVTHGGNDRASDLGIGSFKNLTTADPPILVNEFLRLSRRWSLVFCTLEDVRLWRDTAWEVCAWVRAGVWDRVNPAPQFTGDRPSQAAEAIAIMHNPTNNKRWNAGGNPGIWRYSVEFGHKLHPTQKPLKLIKKLIADFTDTEETILDPFMGSGTTGVACVQTGRNFIGVEIDPEYFKIAEKRIAEAQRQPMLFDHKEMEQPKQASLLSED